MKDENHPRNHSLPKNQDISDSESDTHNVVQCDDDTDRINELKTGDYVLVKNVRKMSVILPWEDTGEKSRS